MKTLIRIVALVMMVAACARGEEADWKKYANPRFGFVLTYPPGLEAGPEPANGAGREFHTADKAFSVLANSHFLMKDDGDSLAKRYQDALKEAGDSVTYKKKTDAWYVVSGVRKDGTEYYIKFFVKGSSWVEIRMQYPHSKNKQYDPWVAKIAKRFTPFSEGDFDRVD